MSERSHFIEKGPLYSTIFAIAEPDVNRNSGLYAKGINTHLHNLNPIYPITLNSSRCTSSQMFKSCQFHLKVNYPVSLYIQTTIFFLSVFTSSAFRLLATAMIPLKASNPKQLKHVRGVCVLGGNECRIIQSAVCLPQLNIS